MTQDELKRYDEGREILFNIQEHKRKIECIRHLLKTDGNGGRCNVTGESIDKDLAVDVLNKQIERYEKKLSELQKQFDEL